RAFLMTFLAIPSLLKEEDVLMLLSSCSRLMRKFLFLPTCHLSMWPPLFSYHLRSSRDLGLESAFFFLALWAQLLFRPTSPLHATPTASRNTIRFIRHLSRCNTTRAETDGPSDRLGAHLGRLGFPACCLAALTDRYAEPAPSRGVHRHPRQ